MDSGVGVCFCLVWVLCKRVLEYLVVFGFLLVVDGLGRGIHRFLAFYLACSMLICVRCAVNDRIR